MFDIGFWELLIIGTVTLLVVGPDRLPGLATFIGQWVGRARRFANYMRSEIQEELEAEHLKNLVNEQKEELQSLRREVEGVRDETETAARDIERSARGETGTVARGASEPEGQSDSSVQPDVAADHGVPGPAAAGDGGSRESGAAASAPSSDPAADAAEPSSATSAGKNSAAKKRSAKKAASKKKSSTKKAAAKSTAKKSVSKKSSAKKTSAAASSAGAGDTGRPAGSGTDGIESPGGGDES